LAKDEARGRVSGYILMSYSLAPLVMFPLSLVAEKYGVDNAITGAAVVVIALVVLFAITSKSLRNIDKHLIQRKPHYEY